MGTDVLARGASGLVVLVAVVVALASGSLPDGTKDPDGIRGGIPGTSVAAMPPAVASTPTVALRESSPQVAVDLPSTPALLQRVGKNLTPADLAQYRPNEAGLIPILQYHVFVSDPALEEQFIHVIDDFRVQLAWLYDHDFYVVPLRDVFLNQISAPLGKHPVALTFDDSTAGQFRFLKGPDGTLVPDPNSAVGVLEEFFAAHPDFGRGGYFAVLPDNCFHVPDEPNQEPYCDQKLRWLVERGYEVGIHTLTHANLKDVSDEQFRREIAEAVLWVRERVPGGSAEDILTMPFGGYPDRALHPNQWTMLREGFTYEGREYRLSGALKVGADPAFPPGSTEWDPFQVPRVQMYDDWVERWWRTFEEQPEILYVSDGDPATITVPSVLPPWLKGSFEPGRADADGKTVLVYQTGSEPPDQSLQDSVGMNLSPPEQANENATSKPGRGSDGYEAVELILFESVAVRRPGAEDRRPGWQHGPDDRRKGAHPRRHHGVRGDRLPPDSLNVSRAAEMLTHRLMPPSAQNEIR